MSEQDASVHAIAGALGGLLSLGLFYPLDVLRSLVQLDDPRVRNLKTSVALAKLYSQGGVLWQGIQASATTQGVSNFVYFYCYNALRLRATTLMGVEQLTTQGDLAIAFLAGVINVLATSPMWVASNRLKVQSKADTADGKTAPRWKSLAEVIIHISKTEGIQALWNGTKASLLLVSNPTIQFATYSQTKWFLMKLWKQDELSGATYFVLAAWAKVAATLLTYPIQIAQNRLRSSPSKRDSKKKGADTDTMLGCLADMVKNEGGLPALYKGIESKMLQTVLTAAFTFLTYEKVVLAVKTARG